MPDERQQFNVTLPRKLVTAVKHRAVDAQLSLSDLVAHVLTEHLAEGSADAMTGPTQKAAVPMSLRPMVHVVDMAASVGFFETLGAEVLEGSRDGDWVLLQLGGARIGLLAHPPNPEQAEGTVELNFEAGAALEELETRLMAAGAPISRPTSDEAFGRQLQLTSPDGLLVKIDETDPHLYT